MNQTQALAKLRKVLGADMAYRTNPKALNAEQRDAARVVWQEARAIAEAAEAARVARLNALLAGDAEYQALKAQAAATKKTADNARAGLYSYRITVGVRNAMFFSIRAEGDNWDEVVTKITKGKP